MKNNNRYKQYFQIALSLLLLLFLATSCEKEPETVPVLAPTPASDTIQTGNATFSIYTTGKLSIQGKGSLITKSIPVTQFTEIELKKIGNVKISTGTEYAVTVSDYENLVDLASVSVTDQRLIIAFADACVKNSRLTIQITTPDPLYSLILSGTGNIEVNSPLNDLSEIILSGNGKMVFRSPVTSDDLYIDMDGDGYIFACGAAENLTAKLGGSGSMDLTGLNAKIASCTITGYGNIGTTVTQNLSALLAGTGHITYYGDPVVVKNVTGTGSITSAE